MVNNECVNGGEEEEVVGEVVDVRGGVGEGAFKRQRRSLLWILKLGH